MLFPAQMECVFMVFLLLLVAIFLIFMSMFACCCSRKTKNLGCCKPWYVTLVLFSWIIVVGNGFNVLLRHSQAYSDNSAK